MQGPAPVPPLHNKELYQGFLLSTLRGLRNGIVCGIRIRLPYIIQAVAYAVIFREKKYVYNQFHQFTIVILVFLGRLVSYSTLVHHVVPTNTPTRLRWAGSGSCPRTTTFSTPDSHFWANFSRSHVFQLVESSQIRAEAGNQPRKKFGPLCIFLQVHLLALSKLCWHP
jgi:hypothetical protein